MYSQDFINRFWSKVDIRGPDECWPWKASIAGKGYGQIRIPLTRRNEGAHRVSLSIKLGRELLPGEKSCHSCDMPWCCNPGHLSEGTQAVNMQDMVRKDRHTWGERSDTAKLKAGQVEEIRQRCAAGQSQRSVADQFGVSQMQVSRIMRGQRWKGTGNVPDTAMKKRTPLTLADVTKIREMCANGAVQGAVAKQYGVHQPTISKIVRGERWATTHEGPKPVKERETFPTNRINLVFKARDAGLTQEQIAKAFGVTQATISRILSGKRHSSV